MNRLSPFIFILCFVSFLNLKRVNATPPAVEQIGTAGGSCAQAFETAVDPTVSFEQQTKEAAAIQAGRHFFSYFEVMRQNLQERDYLLDQIEQALIAKEGVLIMGPPGNAKSLVADTVLGGIIDEEKLKEKLKRIAKANEKQGEPKNSKKNKRERGRKTVAELEAEPINSFFRLQLTAETTMSETHGPLNFKKLTEENVYDRKYEDSMLNFKNVFIDEIFDARPNALRNILGILGERAHSQGGRTRKAKLETFIAATNSYLSQVYEKAGNDGPKAVIDRFSFSSFIPGELEKAKSAVTLIQGAKNETANREIPRLTFQELDQIRELVPDVDIPVHVARFLAVLSKQLKEETETLETASLKQYNNALRNGETAPPPYRASKYHSPRSLGKAAGILKAWVVRDWLKQQLDPNIPHKNKRQLKATLDDVKALEQFFTLNGPSDEFVKKLITRANDDEKSQLEAIERERNIYRKHYADLYQTIQERFHSQLGKYDYEVQGATTPQAKKDAAYKLALQWVNEVEPHLPKTDELSELNGNGIGALMLDELLSQSGIALVGKDDWDRLTQSLIENRPTVAEAPVVKQDERERFETVTGALFILEPHHPILDKAWEDQRALFWKDMAIYDQWGQISVMERQVAIDYCLNLNTNPEQKEQVRIKLKEREAALTPLRTIYYELNQNLQTTEAGKSIRDASGKFKISGCYLPSREEFEDQAIDKGYSHLNSQFKDGIFSDTERHYWTSSSLPADPKNFFHYDGRTGKIGFYDTNPYKAVRCVCSD